MFFLTAEGCFCIRVLKVPQAVWQCRVAMRHHCLQVCEHHSFSLKISVCLGASSQLAPELFSCCGVLLLHRPDCCLPTLPENLYRFLGLFIHISLHASVTCFISAFSFSAGSRLVAPASEHWQRLVSNPGTWTCDSKIRRLFLPWPYNAVQM